MCLRSVSTREHWERPYMCNINTDGRHRKKNQIFGNSDHALVMLKQLQVCFVQANDIVDSGTELLWTVIILFVCSDSCVHRTWVPADTFIPRQTKWLRFLVPFTCMYKWSQRVKLPCYFHCHANNNNNCQAANGYGFWLSVIVYLAINISCKGFTNLTVIDVFLDATNNNNREVANGYCFTVNVIVYLVINILCNGFMNLTMSGALYFVDEQTKHKRK